MYTDAGDIPQNAGLDAPFSVMKQSRHSWMSGQNVLWGLYGESGIQPRVRNPKIVGGVFGQNTVCTRHQPLRYWTWSLRSCLKSTHNQRVLYEQLCEED